MLFGQRGGPTRLWGATLLQSRMRGYLRCRPRRVLVSWFLGPTAEGTWTSNRNMQRRPDIPVIRTDHWNDQSFLLTPTVRGDQSGEISRANGRRNNHANGPEDSARGNGMQVHFTPCEGRRRGIAILRTLFGRRRDVGARLVLRPRTLGFMGSPQGKLHCRFGGPWRTWFRLPFLFAA